MWQQPATKKDTEIVEAFAVKICCKYKAFSAVQTTFFCIFLQPKYRKILSWNSDNNKKLQWLQHGAVSPTKTYPHFTLWSLWYNRGLLVFFYYYILSDSVIRLWYAELSKIDLCNLPLYFFLSGYAELSKLEVYKGFLLFNVLLGVLRIGKTIFAVTWITFVAFFFSATISYCKGRVYS